MRKGKGEGERGIWQFEIFSTPECRPIRLKSLKLLRLFLFFTWQHCLGVFCTMLGIWNAFVPFYFSFFSLPDGIARRD